MGTNFSLMGLLEQHQKVGPNFILFEAEEENIQIIFIFFHMICFDCPNLKMAKIIFHLDFEEAVIQAIREYFPNAIIICCSFHLMQLLKELSRFEPKLWARCCFDKIIKPEVNQIF